MNIETVHADSSISSQITISDIDEIAQAGFKTIMNNRPDHEGGSEQPLSKDIAKRCQELGIHYLHIPVQSPILSESVIQQFRQQYVSLPKPILGFCRTGRRSSAFFESISS